MVAAYPPPAKEGGRELINGRRLEIREGNSETRGGEYSDYLIEPLPAKRVRGGKNGVPASAAPSAAQRVLFGESQAASALSKKGGASIRAGPLKREKRESCSTEKINGDGGTQGGITGIIRKENLSYKRSVQSERTCR